MTTTREDRARLAEWMAEGDDRGPLDELLAAHRLAAVTGERERMRALARKWRAAADRQDAEAALLDRGGQRRSVARVLRECAAELDGDANPERAACQCACGCSLPAQDGASNCRDCLGEERR